MLVEDINALQALNNNPELTDLTALKLASGHELDESRDFSYALLEEEELYDNFDGDLKEIELGKDRYSQLEEDDDDIGMDEFVETMEIGEEE